MRGYYLLLFVFCSTFCSLYGQNSHLLIYSQGDGGIYRTDGGKNEPLVKASFLPNGNRISVRPRSGVETLAAGFQFRFGAGTVFSLNRSEITVEQGALLINSRRLSNQVNLLGPESKLGVSGVGCCLIESSYLVSGFPNSSSFRSSLASITDAQSKMVGKTYGAVVGNAKQSDTFEIVPTKKSSQQAVSASSKPATGSVKYDKDPLSELLGRPPKRFNDNSNQPNSRPFPSKLLRGSN